MSGRDTHICYTCGCIAVLTLCSCARPIDRPLKIIPNDEESSLTTAIGTAVDGSMWDVLATKYQMKHTVLKGSDALESPQRGIEVRSRDHLIWRIILSVNRADSNEAAFIGRLPFGINHNETPGGLIQKLGQPQSDDPQHPQDRWMVYTQRGFLYIFVFRNPTQLDFIMIEADPGTGKL